MTIFLLNLVFGLISCADPGIFVRGGPGQSDKKSSDNVFILVLSLFFRSQMVNFKENYHFSRFQRGSNIFQGGGPTFSRGGGGSNCLFPTETHITCDFSGRGSGPPAPPPLWNRTWICRRSHSTYFCHSFYRNT